MAFKLKVAESEVFGESKYVNDEGSTECVEFVRKATGAPKTSLWTPGLKVADAKQGEISRGTAIATFDDSGQYPTDNFGKHAAIYLRHTASMIEVLDQWKSQGEVRQRSIFFTKPAGTKRSNDGSTFYVIEAAMRVS